MGLGLEGGGWKVRVRGQGLKVEGYRVRVRVIG